MAAKKTIVYSCDPTCVPDVHKKKLKVKKYVYLVADGTGATLNFKTSSPFDPPVLTVTIAQDTFVKMKIGNRTGTFRYSVTCTKCKTQTDDPSMIIEL
jgi:hypothetical protein